MNLPKKNKPFMLILALAAFFQTAFLFSVAASAGPTIYFYNPETNINNFASLKIEFDTYLSRFGEYQFQPFSKKKMFEESIRGKRGGVFMLSSWHYNILEKKFPMKPVLVGVLKGRSTHRKILSAKKQFKEMAFLKGKKIASAGNKEYTRNILLQIFGSDNEEIVNSLKIMPVPKDIDALMAVGFGMAAAALTTERSLVKLKKINPKQYRMLNQLGSSKEMLKAIIAAPEQLDVNSNALIKVLEKMETISEGGNRLRMIGLDGWRKLNQKELEALSK